MLKEKRSYNIVSGFRMILHAVLVKDNLVPLSIAACLDSN